MIKTETPRTDELRNKHRNRVIHAETAWGEMATHAETLEQELIILRTSIHLSNMAGCLARQCLEGQERRHKDFALDVKKLVGVVGAVTAMAGMDFIPLFDFLTKYPEMKP